MNDSINGYIKKPEVISACRWMGDNINILKVFMNPIQTQLLPNEVLVAVFSTYTILVEKGDFVLMDSKGILSSINKTIFVNEYQQIDTQQNTPAAESPAGTPVGGPQNLPSYQSSQDLSRSSEKAKIK